MYSSYLSTSDLQFGFKSGVSTDACTGLLKNTIALHLYRKTKVFGRFLDASKAFDRVNHNTLFKILEKRELPPLLLRFLWSWYKEGPISPAQLNGTPVKPILSGFLTVLGKVGFYLPYCLLCTWTSFCSDCLLLASDAM